MELTLHFIHFHSVVGNFDMGDTVECIEKVQIECEPPKRPELNKSGDVDGSQRRRRRSEERLGDTDTEETMEDEEKSQEMLSRPQSPSRGESQPPVGQGSHERPNGGDVGDDDDGDDGMGSDSKEWDAEDDGMGPDVTHIMMDVFKYMCDSSKCQSRMHDEKLFSLYFLQ